MRTLLVTGFAPFAGHRMNPAQIIAERLDGAMVADVCVASIVLPVEFGHDTQLTFAAIDKLDPIAVLSFGLRSGADSIDIETTAVNQLSGDGHVLKPIVAGAPGSYTATIDVDGIVAAIANRTGVPVCVHHDAGSYLCNHIFYQTLHHTATCKSRCKVGFIHVPHATEHVAATHHAMPSLPIDHLVEAALVAVAAVAEEE